MAIWRLGDLAIYLGIAGTLLATAEVSLNSDTTSKTRPVPDHRVRMTLLSASTDGRAEPISASGPWRRAEPRVARTHTIGDSIRITEWYLDGPRGPEQAFMIDGPRSRTLELEMALDGDRAANVTSRSGDAWDPPGARPTPRAAVPGNQLRLTVETIGAEYPIAIEPAVYVISRSTR